MTDALYIDLNIPDAYLDIYPGADIVTLGTINAERIGDEDYVADQWRIARGEADVWWRQR